MKYLTDIFEALQAKFSGVLDHMNSPSNSHVQNPSTTSKLTNALKKKNCILSSL